MFTGKLTKKQLTEAAKLGDKFEFEDTNLKDLTLVRVFKARTKRQFLMNPQGETFELVKKARKA